MAPVAALRKELKHPHVAPPEQRLAQPRGSLRQDPVKPPKPPELRDGISLT
jgi:hypothetical protein